MVAAGSAIGLGSIWRFPYMAVEHGGAAFLLVYLLCVFVVGIPVTLDGVGALRKLTKPKRLRSISVTASSEKSPMAIRHFKDERCKRTESFGASFVIDGANGSRWMAAEDDTKNQLTMDLGKVKMIKESELYFVRPTAGHAYV